MKDGEIMNENILAVCMPGNESELSLDFLFQSDDYKTISVKNEFQFECFLDDINDISILKQKNKIYYHIDLVKEYLKKNNEKLSKKLKIEKFNPNNEFVLFKLLADNGMVVLANSEYMSLLFVPEKLKKSQKNSLMMLKSMINPEQNFSCIVSGDEYNLENVKYNEILNFLDIEKQRKRM